LEQERAAAGNGKSDQTLAETPQASAGDEDPETGEEPSNRVTRNRFGPRYVEIVKAEMIGADGVPRKVFKSDEPTELAIHYKMNKALQGYVFGFAFCTLEGIVITGSNTQLDKYDIPRITSSGIIKLYFEHLPLLSGKYILRVAVADENGQAMDFYTDYMRFEIISADRSTGLASIPHKWEIAAEGAEKE
jgi:hypothetical protein